MTDQLRKAVNDDLRTRSMKALAEDIGLDRMALTRFASGHTSMHLDLADKLATYYGLELRPKRKGG